MAGLKLEFDTYGKLILDGSFEELSEIDKLEWQAYLERKREATRQGEKDRLLEYLAGELDDTMAVTVPSFFAPWKMGTAYKQGDRVNCQGLLFKCLQAHNAQTAWTPGTAPSLWARIDDPTEEWPQWQQPEGAHDAYGKGAKVSHADKHWISIADHNVWEPGALEPGGLWETEI